MSMLAYQVVQSGAPLEARRVEKPTPTGHQVLAKTSLTGVCHTDIHVIQGDWGRPHKLPLTPGHEGVGIVVAVGPDVTKLKVGDRVGVAWLGSSCMECHLCKAGKENMCENQTQTGCVRDGTFAEYFIADDRFAVKIPDGVTDAEAAPILCAGVTSYKAVRMTEARSGARIVIAGCCGGLGHLAVQYAKAMGYEVVALDKFCDASEAMMKGMGVSAIVNVDSSNWQDKLAEMRKEKPIEASIIFAPDLTSVARAVEYVSPGATISVVSLPSGSFQVEAYSFVLKELRLQGSIVGTPRDLEEAFRFVSEGKVKAHVQEMQFESVNEVLKNLKEGKIRGRAVLRVAKPLN